MNRIFVEPGIEKVAQPEGMPQTPSWFMQSSTAQDSLAPQTPSGPQGPASPVPQAGKWVGPRTSVFQPTSMSVPIDPARMLDMVLNSLSQQHPYLAQFPMEPEIVEQRDNITLGEVKVTSPSGVLLSVPFVIRDGKLRPMVVCSVDGNVQALGDPARVLSMLQPPSPGLPVGAPGSANATGSTGGATSLSSLTAAPDLDEQAAMLSEIGKTWGAPSDVPGVGPSLGKLLTAEPDVVQFLRVPGGVVVRQAFSGRFEPIEKTWSLDDVPQETLSAFSEIPAITDVRGSVPDPELQKIAAKAKNTDYRSVDLWQYSFGHRFFGPKGETEKVRYPEGLEYLDNASFPQSVRVFPVVNVKALGSSVEVQPAKGDSGDGCGECPKTGWGESGFLFIGKDGTYLEVSDDEVGHNVFGKPLDKGPDSSLLPISSGEKGYGYLIAKIPDTNRKNPDGSDSKEPILVEKAFGPMEFTPGGNSVEFGGNLYDYEVTGKVKRPSIGTSRTKLYFPSGAKFAPCITPLEGPMSLQNGELPLDVVDDSEDGKFSVKIRKAASDVVVLEGLPLQGVSWGGQELNGAQMSVPDALFVLGALGVEESESISKLAAAFDQNASSPMVRALTMLRGPDSVSVDLGMLKLAADFSAATDRPDLQERFLALQFLGDKTLAKALDSLPAIQQFLDDIAVITLASQIGYGGVDESVAYQALKNLQELLNQLTQLQTERAMMNSEFLGSSQGA